MPIFTHPWLGHGAAGFISIVQFEEGPAIRIRLEKGFKLIPAARWRRPGAFVSVTRQRQGKEIRFVVEPHQLAATGRWLQRMAQRYSPHDLGGHATAQQLPHPVQ